MEQEKLYVIEEKTYEAHIDEEVHLYGLLHQPVSYTHLTLPTIA